MSYLDNVDSPYRFSSREVEKRKLLTKRKTANEAWEKLLNTWNKACADYQNDKYNGVKS